MAGVNSIWFLSAGPETVHPKLRCSLSQRKCRALFLMTKKLSRTSTMKRRIRFGLGVNDLHQVYDPLLQKNVYRVTSGITLFESASIVNGLYKALNGTQLLTNPILSQLLPNLCRINKMFLISVHWHFSIVSSGDWFAKGLLLSSV